MNKQLTRWMLCLPLLAGFTGCSAYQTSHVIEPDLEPGLSLNAVASADGELVLQPFSLVAADSVGLSTFAYEIAMWEHFHGDNPDRTASAE